jgi:hypothetical protein
MARRRAGTSRSVKRRRSPNYGVVTSGARGVRRLAKSVKGQPSVLLKRPSSTALRGVRTLIRRDPSKGITQPEARKALLTNQSIVAGGVRVDSRSQTAPVISKSKVTSPLAGQTKIRPPRLGPLKRRGNAT